ncbi:hypothetical protein A0H81_08561 [Grifola frondosa]|uniref:Uncharacterized protein n=1 Tax=Grifola frondosa TaxID=5627 RepID=A0A1C7M4A1_GRIFR|nr:hypothetical protein A0H81_08561 [Grifola frondosa]
MIGFLRHILDYFTNPPEAAHTVGGVPEQGFSYWGGHHLVPIYDAAGRTLAFTVAPPQPHMQGTFAPPVPITMSYPAFANAPLPVQSVSSLLQPPHPPSLPPSSSSEQRPTPCLVRPTQAAEVQPTSLLHTIPRNMISQGIGTAVPIGDQSQQLRQPSQQLPTPCLTPPVGPLPAVRHTQTADTLATSLSHTIPRQITSQIVGTTVSTSDQSQQLRRPSLQLPIPLPNGSLLAVGHTLAAEGQPISTMPPNGPYLAAKPTQTAAVQPTLRSHPTPQASKDIRTAITTGVHSQQVAHGAVVVHELGPQDAARSAVAKAPQVARTIREVPTQMFPKKTQARMLMIQLR